MADAFRCTSDYSDLEWTCSPGSRSPLLMRDPLFYSAAYEQELLDQYLPQSMSHSECMASMTPTRSTPSPFQELDALEPAHFDLLMDDLDTREPTESPPVPSPMMSPIKEEPLVRVQRSRKPARYASTSPLQEAPIKKRGRPSGQKSNSKMATYAKNYREMKKSETRTLASQVEDLKSENDRLRRDCELWKDRYATLKSEIRDMTPLKQWNNIPSQMSSLLSALQDSNGSLRLCISADGQPYLELTK